MTNIKNIKRSILSSVMAVVLCFAMLLGTTFAWFTDTVASSTNLITAGNLDIALEYKTQWSDEWAPVDENTKLFKEGALYEPGYTEVVFLRVSNVGSLALKYILSLNITNEEGSTNVNGEKFMLSDYLQVGTYLQDEYNSGFNYADILMPNMFGTRANALNNVDLATLAKADLKVTEEPRPILPGEKTAQVAAIVLTMPTDIENAANTMVGYELPYVELGVRLYATQVAYENDTYGSGYDGDVYLGPVHHIENVEDLERAFKEGGQGYITNMNLTDVAVSLATNKSLELNTNNSTISGNGNDFVISNKGALNLTGDGTIVNNMKGSVENYGKLYVNNLNIEVKGEKYGFHSRDGEMELNNIFVHSERGGLNVQGGKVTMNSGSFTTTSYGTKTGHLVYAESLTSSNVTINGGNFEYIENYYKHGVLYAGQNATITVNGGTFDRGGSNTSKTKWITAASGGVITINGGTFGIEAGKTTKAQWFEVKGGNGSIIVKGGKFEFDPGEFVAEGYKAVQGEDGWYTVVKA